MAKRKAKQMLVSAKSELRKGFAVPSKKKIFLALRQRSKTFIMNLFWFAFTKLNKTDKIKALMRIERKGTRRKSKRRKSRTKRRKSRTRRKKSKTRRKSGKRRTAKQRAATRKLVAFNRRRRR